MVFVKESFIGAAPEKVFAFHCLFNALELLTPPWERVRIIQSADISRIGSRAIIETRVFGMLKMHWVAEHTLYNPPAEFVDVQRSGPFREWQHRHIVEPRDKGAVLRDEITYEPPLGWLGRGLAPWLIEPRLRRLFDYRHSVTRRWCERDETLNQGTHANSYRDLEVPR